jgi:response regulator RpfG family c-di-GMP phosphodiesterase
MDKNSKEKINILTVDDRQENLFLLENILARPDINILKAMSGAEALKLAAENDLALILLDVRMPIMDGYQVATFLRESQKSKYVPIIFITAMSEGEQQMFKGYEAGAVDYLFKPINSDILKSKLNIFLELYNQKRLIEKQNEELNIANQKLQAAFSHIKELKGILPICVHCKKIRDDKGYWEQVEQYIEKHADVGFSHGICPDCLQKYFPDEAEEILDELKSK